MNLQTKQLVRLQTGPLPLTGLVQGEDHTFSGKPCWKVLVFGYSLSKVEYWLKEDCKDCSDAYERLNIAGWIELASR